MEGITSKHKELFLLILISLTSLSINAEIVELENETEIQYAVAMNEAIDHLSEKIMNCIEDNNGKTEGCICTSECSCKFKDDYLSAHNSYQQAIKAYPSWENKGVFYQQANDATGYAINFAALKTQFSTSCQK